MDWKPYKHAEAYDITVRSHRFRDLPSPIIYKRIIWTAAGTADYEAVTTLTGEPLLISMDDWTKEAKGALYLTDEHISVFELWETHKRRSALRKEYLDYWKSSIKLTGTGRPVDAIISPCAFYVAHPHGKNM